MSAQLPLPDDVRTPIQYGNLTYSNPHGQIVHARWANGEVVYSFPLGKVAVDATKTKVAEEYILIYGFTQGGEPEKAIGQYTIYDSRPGDQKYSPIWHHNLVVVPRDYVPQTLRSEADVLRSGYQIQPTDVYTN
jgi:hypothetical protein